MRQLDTLPPMLMLVSTVRVTLRPGSTSLMLPLAVLITHFSSVVRFAKLAEYLARFISGLLTDPKMIFAQSFTVCESINPSDWYHRGFSRNIPTGG